MCYHNSLTKKAVEISSRFKAKIEPEIEFESIYHANGFSYPKWPVITSGEPDRIQLFSWGLIPFWVKTKEDALKFKVNTLNAKAETIFEKPSFKFSITKKRCLIPSTGFFEWRDFNKKKYPYFIHLKNEEIFSMGGIYETWVDKETGEICNTFSIVTTEANSLMAMVHNSKKRMPLILSGDYEAAWLDKSFKKDQIPELMKPFDETLMKAYTISKLITSRTEPSNVPEISQPFSYSELI